MTPNIQKIETFLPELRYLGKKNNELWFYKYQETENGLFETYNKKDISMNITENYFLFLKDFGNFKIVLKTKSPKISSNFLNKIKETLMDLICF